MVLVMVLLLAKQIITLYHVVQKTLTKDQHALFCLMKYLDCFVINKQLTIPPRHIKHFDELLIELDIYSQVTAPAL
ncbi:hypothetical protein D0856_03105 [Vibrio owensii]|nr:hypothetical protein D0856_03105 [Vibrio owensii]